MFLVLVIIDCIIVHDESESLSVIVLNFEFILITVQHAIHRIGLWFSILSGDSSGFLVTAPTKFKHKLCKHIFLTPHAMYPLSQAEVDTRLHYNPPPPLTGSICKLRTLLGSLIV